MPFRPSESGEISASANRMLHAISAAVDEASDSANTVVLPFFLENGEGLDIVSVGQVIDAMRELKVGDDHVWGEVGVDFSKARTRPEPHIVFTLKRSLATDRAGDDVARRVASRVDEATGS
ncbi:MAG: hypothetical protein AAB592_05355 [Patescibacteria group bacterium]